MPTVTLTVHDHNDLRVRAALAAHRVTTARNGNPESGPSNEGACRGIPGPEKSPEQAAANQALAIHFRVTRRPLAHRRRPRAL